jgi:hypothetical protein
MFQVILLLKYVERYSLMKCHSLPREPSSLDGEGTTSSDLKKLIDSMLLMASIQFSFVDIIFAFTKCRYAVVVTLPF